LLSLKTFIQINSAPHHPDRRRPGAPRIKNTNFKDFLWNFIGILYKNIEKPMKNLANLRTTGFLAAQTAKL